MVALLQQIVSAFVCWVETACVTVINMFVFLLGALMAGFAAVMPTIPSAPALPGPMTTALSWIAWVFPVQTLVDIFAFLILAWVLWFALSIAMRWARAIG